MQRGLIPCEKGIDSGRWIWVVRERMDLQNVCGVWKTYRLTQLQSINLKRRVRYRLDNSMKMYVKEISMRVCVGFSMFRIRENNGLLLETTVSLSFEYKTGGFLANRVTGSFQRRILLYGMYYYYYYYYYYYLSVSIHLFNALKANFQLNYS
jgi:hypothetical protein